MKVRIVTTVDIDAEAWTREYGVEGADEIRRDVQEHAASMVRQQYDAIGVLADGERGGQ